MNSIFGKIILTSLLTLFFLVPVSISAQTQPRGGTQNPTPSFQIRIPNPLAPGPGGQQTDSIPKLLDLIIDKILLPIGGVVVVIMIIYSGFLYVTAQGAPDKIKTAHQAILYAAIGAAILLGARVLATAIEATITQLGG